MMGLTAAILSMCVVDGHNGSDGGVRESMVRAIVNRFMRCGTQSADQATVPAGGTLQFVARMGSNAVITILVTRLISHVPRRYHGKVWTLGGPSVDPICSIRQVCATHRASQDSLVLGPCAGHTFARGCSAVQWLGWLRHQDQLVTKSRSHRRHPSSRLL